MLVRSTGSHKTKIKEVCKRVMRALTVFIGMSIINTTTLIINKLRLLRYKTNYRLHLKVRSYHDNIYKRGGSYKKWTDKKYSSAIHKTVLTTFVVTLVFIQGFSYFYPQLNLWNPGQVFAGTAQKVWNTLADFTNNNGLTANITNSNINLNSGDPKLFTTSGNQTQNTTAQFNTHTKSNTATGTNNVFLLKPIGATATNPSECASNLILSGVCAAYWLPGRTGSVLAGKEVFYRDIEATDLYTSDSAIGGTGQPIWKTTTTDCVSPQCTVSGPVAEAQAGYTGKEVLVASNTVDFALSTNPPTYPARDACKVLGGRLPTIAELLELYNNKALYGNNFQSYLYWSSTESTNANPYVVYLANGSIYGTYPKNQTGFYTRCVR